MRSGAYRVLTLTKVLNPLLIPSLDLRVLAKAWQSHYTKITISFNMRNNYSSVASRPIVVQSSGASSRWPNDDQQNVLTQTMRGTGDSSLLQFLLGLFSLL